VEHISCAAGGAIYMRPSEVWYLNRLCHGAVRYAFSVRIFHFPCRPGALPQARMSLGFQPGIRGLTERITWESTAEIYTEPSEVWKDGTLTRSFRTG
ncbi:MAG: hypothetical protein ACI8W8_004368, partial [Rhodothermales bacterium]